MKVCRLDEMIGGWFVGDFSPAAHRSATCEVAYKQYRAGEREDAHVHKVATEITAIVSGRVRMNGVEYTAGDIIVLAPGEPTDFEALEDTSNVVVKLPSVKGDKYTMAADQLTANTEGTS